MKQPEAKKAKKPPKLKTEWIDFDAQPFSTDGLQKYQINLLSGIATRITDEAVKKLYLAIDPLNPLNGSCLEPGLASPICQACKLHEHGSEHPFMAYAGADQPLVTIVCDSVSAREDIKGAIAAEGPAQFFKNYVNLNAEMTSVTSDEIRFVAATRCAHRIKGKPVNYKTKGEYCRNFLVQDLKEHRPKVIIAVGTQALGLLSHKGNAQEWNGRVLTYRGWPDDWLTNKAYVERGHPFFGAPPGPQDHVVLYALQAPRLVYATQNKAVIDKWKKDIGRGLILARHGTTPKNYNLPYYRLLTDPNEVRAELQFIADCPGMVVCYDTETTGLRPWMDQKIVFMMFRYTHPKTGLPVAFGFPWDYAQSPLIACVKVLSPYVLGALTASKLIGHNLTFDVLFTTVTLGNTDEYMVVDEVTGQLRAEWRAAQERLNALADASNWDTWHMAYCFQQQRGSLGLEVLAYAWVPALAGYEEDMTLLIDLHRDIMHPDEGGHYAMCPAEKWETHLKPYVMGDVEVAYQAKSALDTKLQLAKTYRIPLAHTTRRGDFRHFQPPSRGWIYDKIMAPASRMLTKIMGRGMFIDMDELARLEVSMPAEIRQLREQMGRVTPNVEQWVAKKEATDEHRNTPDKRWELDLDNKEQLRDILFNVLNLPVQRLTKTGHKFYGEDPLEWDDRIRAILIKKDDTRPEEDHTFRVRKELLSVAAMDKFTLNKMSVDHAEVRPLQDYRKVHKLYSTYVRPLRNVTSNDVDKKRREQMQHLCPDGMIHAQFMLTGTRGGRLSSRCLPLSTPVSTQKGTVPLESVEPGDMIQAANGPSRVLAFALTGQRPTLCFELEYGRRLECSPDHLILVNRAWKRAADVSVGDNFYVCGIASPQASLVKCISEAASQEMCDIEVEHGNFLVNGICVHNSPNLQNLPRKGSVKKMFTSRFGQAGCLYGADLSQIELRLLAAACGDVSMVEAYEKKLDLHSLTASRIFKRRYEDFHKDHFKWLQENGRDSEAKDLDLKRSISKCVDPDTLISVNGRIQRIGTLHAGRDEDTFYPMTGLVIQGPGGGVPIKYFYSNGIKSRLLVCSRRGLVACSTEHPFLLKSGVLKAAKDIAVGNELVDPVMLNSQSAMPNVKFCPFGTKPIDGHFQIQVDANLAYLLGMFYGDGCSNIGEVSICTGGRQEFFEWQDIIAESVVKAGFSPKVTRTLWSSDTRGPKIVKSGPTAGSKIYGATGLVNFGCTRVSDIFIQLGAVENTPKRRRTLKIPEWLFNATRELKMSFLAGWIDTDGSCARQGSLSGLTKSWVFAQDLMVLLDSCGVGYWFEPSWNKTYHRFYFRINITVKDSWNHFYGILRHPTKRQRLHKPRFVYNKQRANTVIQIIPLAPGHLVDVEVDTEDHLFVCNSSTCRNTANFLTGYGGGAFGLQTSLANNQVYLQLEECERIIAAFFDSYPALKEFLRHYKRFIEQTQVAVSIFGRVRVFEEVLSDDKEAKSKALRAGANHLIQATASDMMLVCLVVIEDLMRQAQLDSMLVSTVHDSLVIDALRRELPQVHEIVDYVLNNIPEVFESYFGPEYDRSWMLVDFAGDSEVGINYNSMQGVGLNPDWDKLLEDKAS